jgi:hypothetical protein
MENSSSGVPTTSPRRSERPRSATRPKLPFASFFWLFVLLMVLPAAAQNTTLDGSKGPGAVTIQGTYTTGSNLILSSGLIMAGLLRRKFRGSLAARGNS